MKNTVSKNQKDKFINLGCDESQAAFAAKLKKLATQKPKSKKRRIDIKFLFLVLVLFTSHAYATEVETPPPMPLDQQERAEQLNKAIAGLNNLKASIEQHTEAEINHCMKAIGNREFCVCIANNAPGNINFTQYVEFFRYSPEEFDYKKLSPEDKKLYDGIRAARDQCVNWKGKN